MSTDIDKPYIDDIEVGEYYVVVSWMPSSDPPSNPASEFVVEYRPEGTTMHTSWPLDQFCHTNRLT